MKARILREPREKNHLNPFAFGLRFIPAYRLQERERDENANNRIGSSAIFGRLDVGVIGVALFRRKQEPPFSKPRISQSSAPSRAAESASDAQRGTVHGRREHSPAMHVTFDRATSAPAEVLTLYSQASFPTQRVNS